MRKKEFSEVFKNAIENKAVYIGVCIQTEGSDENEIIINPAANFEDKLKYYKSAYDEDMVLVAAKGKKDIRITAVAQGDSFSDIEWQMIGDMPDWKESISTACDNVVKRMLENFPEITEKQKEAWNAITEGFKENFYKQRYTISQKRFIAENQKKYEDMFEICMNGTNEEFVEAFNKLSKELNENA